jgi:hypothetical protein
MGCDIHWVLEQKLTDKWVGIYSTDLTPMPKGRIVTRGQVLDRRDESAAVTVDTWHDIDLQNRHYDWFGRLAGVRTNGPDPLGMPHDASDLSQACASDWGGDGHSHSYLPAVDFVAKYLDESDLVEHIAAKFDPTLTDNLLEWLGLDEFAATHQKDFRVVFWFDN